MQLLLCLWLAVVDGGAPPTIPPDTVVSPEVHPDRRITFRLGAPGASEVRVAGEWTLPPNTPQKMTRDGHGVWSITVGPVEPNIYIYTFEVNGLTIPDPVNPSIKLRARGSASMVEVPGGQPWEFRDVPHGSVEVVTHAPATLGKVMRQVFVYLPPGYDRSRGRYPVTYLLHGNNDLAAGWTMAGRANLILDNLIAEKKAVPMIVVMPWGHALPFGARPPAGQPSNNDVFEDYLVKDVMPLVEAKYRMAGERRKRAVVGLSMGGAQALALGLRHPDRFATIGVFGSGMTRADLDARYKKTGDGMDLVFVGIGREDGSRAKARELSEALGARGLPALYKEVEGGHTYPVWRKLLVETAPLLFRPVARGTTR